MKEVKSENSNVTCQRSMVIKMLLANSSAYDPVRDDEIAKFAVHNILEEMLGKRGVAFEYTHDAFGVIVFGTVQELDDHSMKSFASFVASCIKKYGKISVQIGIGDLVHSFLTMNKSIHSAMKALNSVRSRTSGEIVFPDEKKDSASPPSQESGDFVDKVKVLLQQDCGKNVCLKTIAKQLYVNPIYLGRLFKAKEGISFNDYLLSVRMEKAKQLLLKTDNKVYEIAEEVGYRQLDWFYKRFKEYTGQTAVEFKNRSAKDLITAVRS